MISPSQAPNSACSVVRSVIVTENFCEPGAFQRKDEKISCTDEIKLEHSADSRSSHALEEPD